MSISKLFISLLLSLFFVFSITGAAFAQIDGSPDELSGQQQNVTIQDKARNLPAEFAISSEDLSNSSMLEKSWQRGGDLRVNLTGFIFVSNNIAEVSGGNFGFDLGYRWKHFGLYFHFDFSLYPPSSCEEAIGFWFTLGARGLFYVPLMDNMELVLGIGIYDGMIEFIELPLSAGLSWHLGNMILGFDLVYQPKFNPAGYSDELEYFHELRATFVIGYTF